MKGIFQIPDFQFDENRLKQIIQHADLRNGHEGLVDVAKKEEVDINKLRQGEMVVFINTSRTAFKALIGGTAAMFYFREPYGRQFHRELIFTIPKWFRGGKLAYTEQLKKTIEKEITR